MKCKVFSAFGDLQQLLCHELKHHIVRCKEEEEWLQTLGDRQNHPTKTITAGTNARKGTSIIKPLAFALERSGDKYGTSQPQVNHARNGHASCTRGTRRQHACYKLKNTHIHFKCVGTCVHVASIPCCL